MSLPSDVPVKFTTEFMNPEEFADGGSYPLAGQKSEFYARFFHFVYPIPLGPALLIAGEYRSFNGQVFKVYAVNAGGVGFNHTYYLKTGSVVATLPNLWCMVPVIGWLAWCQHTVTGCFNSNFYARVATCTIVLIIHLLDALCTLWDI